MDASDFNRLTPRERQVLDELLEGRTVREIAARHGLSPRTVKNYVSTLYDKLEVQDRWRLSRLRGGRRPGQTLEGAQSS